MALSGWRSYLWHHTLQRLLVIIAVWTALQKCEASECFGVSPICPTPTGATVLQVTCSNESGTPQTQTQIGSNTHLTVTVTNCHDIPTGLLANMSSTLTSVSVFADDLAIRLMSGTFDGLDYVKQLCLSGFAKLKHIDADVLRPFRKIESVSFIGVGATYLHYHTFGAVLAELSGTQLRRILLHNIQDVANIDKTLNVTELFDITDVSVEELIFSDNFVTKIVGKLSAVLPRLIRVCFSLSVRYNDAVSFTLDALINFKALQEIVCYNYPNDECNPISANSPIMGSFANLIDPETLFMLFFNHRDSDCYAGVKLPFSHALERLIVHNIRFLDPSAHVLCYEENNTMLHFDFSGCPMPAKAPRIRGVKHLRSLRLDGTRISEFPLFFLKDLPMLEVLSLTGLPLGSFMELNASTFFEFACELKELHLGDTQLTTFPHDALVGLTSLEHLNLTNANLASFNVDLRNCTKLGILNLSGNALRSLPDTTLTQIDTIANARYSQNAGKLLIDLSCNPLICLCNSTKFVRWLKSNAADNKVGFPRFDNYTCMHPNGSQVSLSALDMEKLTADCSVIDQLVNGSDCPCDTDTRQRLSLVSSSLYGYFCKADGDQLIPMTVHPLPTCACQSKDQNSNTRMHIGIIVFLSIVVIILIVIIIILAKRGSQYHQLGNRSRDSQAI